jgi:hypothetical protein
VGGRNRVRGGEIKEGRMEEREEETDLSWVQASKK